MGFVGTGRESRDADYRSAVGAQEPRKYVSLDSIAYTDSGGSGPVLICLHAIGHGARDFEDLSRRLSPEYRVIALDFPNQGNSGADSQPASGTRYSKLLSDLIERLDLQSVTLLGNSIGAATAIRYTHLYPERVRALVLCDSGGLGPSSRLSGVFIGAFVQFSPREDAGRSGFLGLLISTTAGFC
jgi:pimeloyl-ACP methyl ester carboxylesterase